MVSFRPIIGLEVHIELKTKSKMFCSCSADYFGSEPNSHVCPVCLGLPGALPVANQKAIEWTVLAGLALNCRIPLFSKFDRKNYFYPDLPKGYQISQYDLPLAVNGQLQLVGTDGKPRIIKIKRVHLEEDTAKMIHTLVGQQKVTLLDFNRAGVPLMEIVTEPEIETPAEAKQFLKQLQQIIRYLGISDCDLEKGSMRCEANISLKKPGERGLPDYKVEVKNLNSFRFVVKALEYEVKRQTQFLKQNKKPRQETRGWDEVKQITVPQRVKEEAQDYRYFPEPDLPPIKWKKAEIKKIKELLPELPAEKMARFQKEYGLSFSQAQVLVKSAASAAYFEEAVKIGRRHGITADQLANVIINKRVNLRKLLPAELVAFLVKKKTKPKLSAEELTKVIRRVLKDQPQAVGDYRKGKTTAIEFLVGQTMKITKGQADPNQIRAIIAKIIK